MHQKRVLPCRRSFGLPKVGRHDARAGNDHASSTQSTIGLCMNRPMNQSYIYATSTCGPNQHFMKSRRGHPFDGLASQFTSITYLAAYFTGFLCLYVTFILLHYGLEQMHLGIHNMVR